MLEAKTEEAIKKSDLVIDLDLSDVSVFNVKKIDYCYNIGYITTLTKIEEIKEMLKE